MVVKTSVFNQTSCFPILFLAFTMKRADVPSFHYKEPKHSIRLRIIGYPFTKKYVSTEMYFLFGEYLGSEKTICIS